MDFFGQIYKITNIKNHKIYIGLTYKKGYKEDSYKIRFQEHMTGKGSVLIHKEISAGVYTPADFRIDLLKSNILDLDELRSWEIYYVDYFKSLVPNGYNGNRGGLIVQTEEVKAKIRKTRKERQHTYKINPPPPDGKTVYVSTITQERIRTNKDDIRVISGEYVHVNYIGDLCKERLRNKKKEEERKKYNGLTKAQHDLYERMKGDTTITKNENWQQGRIKFRSRIKKKEFTEKELEAYNNRSITVKNDWDKRDEAYRKEKTRNGQESMNKIIYTCEHCGKTMNKGNLKRWHGDKCGEKK